MHSCLQILSALSGTVGDKPESHSLFNLKQELTVTFYTNPCEKQALKPEVLLASSDSFFGVSSRCPPCYRNTQLDKGSTAEMWCFQSCRHSFLLINWALECLLKVTLLLRIDSGTGISLEVTADWWQFSLPSQRKTQVLQTYEFVEVLFFIACNYQKMITLKVLKRNTKEAGEIAKPKLHYDIKNSGFWR